jgi:hypothetical protein
MEGLFFIAFFLIICYKQIVSIFVLEMTSQEVTTMEEHPPYFDTPSLIAAHKPPHYARNWKTKKIPFASVMRFVCQAIDQAEIPSQLKYLLLQPPLECGEPMVHYTLAMFIREYTTMRYANQYNPAGRVVVVDASVGQYRLTLSLDNASGHKARIKAEHFAQLRISCYQIPLVFDITREALVRTVQNFFGIYHQTVNERRCQILLQDFQESEINTDFCKKHRVKISGEWRYTAIFQERLLQYVSMSEPKTSHSLTNQPILHISEVLPAELYDRYYTEAEVLGLKGGKLVLDYVQSNPELYQRSAVVLPIVEKPHWHANRAVVETIRLRLGVFDSAEFVQQDLAATNADTSIPIVGDDHNIYYVRRKISQTP